MTADRDFVSVMYTVDPRPGVVVSSSRMLEPPTKMKRQSSSDSGIYMPSDESDYGADDASRSRSPSPGEAQVPMMIPISHTALESTSLDHAAHICTSSYTCSVNLPVPDPCVRHISMKELAAANTDRLGWVAVRGSVYDLTKFLKRHPGGTTILRAGFGRDVTGVFESSHDDSVMKVLK